MLLQCILILDLTGHSLLLHSELSRWFPAYVYSLQCLTFLPAILPFYRGSFTWFWRTTPFCISFSTRFWHSVVYLKMSEFYLIIELLFTWDQMCSSVNVYLVLFYVQQDPEPLGSFSCLTGPACVLTSPPQSARVCSDFSRTSLLICTPACCLLLLKTVNEIYPCFCFYQEFVPSYCWLAFCSETTLQFAYPVGLPLVDFTWSPVLSSAE